MPGSGSPIASFECQLDAGPWVACTSPWSYTGLPNGSHTFRVRAIDAAGNVDDVTPATFTWVVNVADTQCSVCVLSPTANKALELTGNADIRVDDGGVIVNSTASTAATVGGNADVTADYIGGPAAPSGFKTTGNGDYHPNPVHLAAVTDPLVGVAQCTTLTCTNTNQGNKSVSGNSSLDDQPRRVTARSRRRATGSSSSTRAPTSSRPSSRSPATRRSRATA